MPDHMRTKRIVMKLDDGESGAVSADIATLGVTDKDGDVTVQGFFGTQHVAIVQAHDWGTVMLGKGVITDEDGEKARFAGLLNMDPADTDALALHSRLKFDLEHEPALLDWSYGFDILDGGSRPLDPSKNDGARQELKPKDDGTPGSQVFEVSPVLLGAGEGTGTTGVKASGPPTAAHIRGFKLVDHIAQVRLELMALHDRVAEVNEQREERGQELGKGAIAALVELTGAFETWEDHASLLVATAPAAQTAHAIYESIVGDLPAALVGGQP